MLKHSTYQAKDATNMGFAGRIMAYGSLADFYPQKNQS